MFVLAHAAKKKKNLQINTLKELYLVLTAPLPSHGFPLPGDYYTCGLRLPVTSKHHRASSASVPRGLANPKVSSRGL